MSNQKKYLTDQEYKFIYKRVPRLCLDFVVVKNNQILLSKRDIDPYKGYWHLPGGMVRYKETFDEAAERILLGELGLKPVSKKTIGYLQMPNETDKDGIPMHNVTIVFLTKLESGKIRGSYQAHEIKFFTSLPKKVHPVHGKFLKDNWYTIAGNK